MNRDRLWLFAYLAALIALTSVHDPRLLGAALLTVLLLAGGEAGGLLRRGVRAVAPFALLVSGGYAFAAWAGGAPAPWPTLLLINLRVVALACLTLLFIARVNLFRAFAFSPGLSYLLSLTMSQALTLRRAHEEFRLALASRAIERPRLIDRYRAAAAEASWLIEKGLAAARDSALALRARGLL